MNLITSGSHEENDADLEDLFDQIDTDESGKIDYGEFVTAAVNKKKILNEKNLEMVFKLYDKNDDGLISYEEFNEVFKSM